MLWANFLRLDLRKEYSAYFEATYISLKDRRKYLDELIARGKPSFGHLGARVADG